MVGCVVKDGEGLMIGVDTGSLVISVCACSEGVSQTVVIGDRIFIGDVWDDDVCVEMEGRCLHFSNAQWWWKIIWYPFHLNIWWR